MKKIIVLILVVFFCLSLFSRQETEQSADVVEYMKITDVQLIVRAIKDGIALKGLTAEDFKLYENNHRVPVSSLVEVRRKIADQNLQQPEKRKGRFFFFYFWVCEEGLKYKKALNYFYDQVFLKGDKVLMVVKDKYLWVRDKGRVSHSLRWLDENINKIQDDFLSLRRRIMDAQERNLRMYWIEISKKDPHHGYLERYRKMISYEMEQSWKEYQYKYLISNDQMLKNFAGKLQKIDLEKWGVIFFQQGAFPYINQSFARNISEKIPGEGRAIDRMLRKYQLKTQKPDQFFNKLKEVEQSFVQADTTFNFLYMSSDKGLGANQNYQFGEFRLENPYVGWREALKGITKVTGGDFLQAARVEESMEKVIEREDIYYRLTYSPRELKKGKKREIKIFLEDPKVNIYHLQKVNLNKQYLSSELEGVKLKKKRIKNFSGLRNIQKKACLVDSVVNENWGIYFKDSRNLPYSIISKDSPLSKIVIPMRNLKLNGKKVEICLLARDPEINRYELKIVKKNANDLERISFTRKENNDYFIAVISSGQASCYYSTI